jgi:thioredoxin 1
MKIEITDKNFKNEVLESKKPVLVMFWGSWCPVCKRAEPILKEISEEVKSNIKIRKINVDRNPRTSIKYEIMGTPNFCIFNNGKLIRREVGSRSKNQILDMINDL